MSNDRLSPREHAELRDVLLAGTQRIKPAGAHRMQLIAASVALVLVAGVTGGAIATAAIFGSEAIPPAVTPTPTESSPAPTPTPSETPTSEPPAGGVLPFGGECENALTDAESTAMTGMTMTLADYRWRSGAEDALGGIDCLWLTTEVYAGAETRVFAYPEDEVADSVKDAVTQSCDGEFCSLSGVIDGTWPLVQSTTTVENGNLERAQALFDSVAARLARFAAPVAAPRTADWWVLPDCAALVDRLDPTAIGYERVELSEVPSGDGTHPMDIPTLAGARSLCAIYFSSGSGNAIDGASVHVTVHPGGAIAFDTVRQSEFAEAVAISAPYESFLVYGNERLEGSPSVLMVSDGVNTLGVSNGGSNPDDEYPYAGLAELIIAEL